MIFDKIKIIVEQLGVEPDIVTMEHHLLMIWMRTHWILLVNYGFGRRI